jgi:hypothetical protein
MPDMTSPADGDPARTAGPDEPGPPDLTSGAAAPTPTTTGATGAGLPKPLATRPSLSAADIVTGDWPAQAADRIVDVVDTVRDKTTGPVQTAARGAVYGLMAAILAVVVFVLVIIFAIRGLDILVDEFIPWGGIWLPYLILGVVFLLAGTVLFRRRRPSAT